MDTSPILLKMKTLVLFAVVMAISGGCRLFKSDDPEPKTELEKLPPITQEGRNTFGCLVNGKAFAVTSAYEMTAIYQGGGVQFGAGGIYMVVVDPFSIGVHYDFKDVGKGTSRAKYTKEVGENMFCFYEYSNTFSGSLDVSKIDKVDYVISGLFEFSTVTPGCDTIKITNGRFDMQYIP
jgi:hypothetical protein